MPRRLKVNSRRNSECSAPLASLDWSQWFTDGRVSGLYLHVHGPDDTIHRVYCRHSETPRLSFQDGELWWLVDSLPADTQG